MVYNRNSSSMFSNVSIFQRGTNQNLKEIVKYGYSSQCCFQLSVSEYAACSP